MPKIFISYRRDDTAPISTRIADALKDHFGPDDVFFDARDIPLGVDFREYLANAVGRCRILLAVISRNWVGSFPEPTGTWSRRIDDPGDFVRIEVESAFRLGTKVIPVHIDDASMPTQRELPPTLQRLAHLNAATVRRADGFEEDVERLVAALADVLEAGDSPAPHAEPVRDTPEFKRGGIPEAELRPGTILLAEVAIDWDEAPRSEPERVLGAVGTCLVSLEAIATKFGGTCERIDVDHRIRAIFATEASAHAAVNAAVEMRTQVERDAHERGLSGVIALRAGANSGSMITHRRPAGAGGLNVGGEAVEVAKRLEENAPPGSILVGEETWRATRASFDWDGPRNVSEDGTSVLRAAAVTSRISQPHRPRPSELPDRESPLIGREAELSRLCQALSTLADGQGGVATLTGEAGIGKSRLLSELAASEDAQRVGWLEGRGLPIGASLSFHPFSDLLRGWAGVSGESELATIQERAERAIRDLFAAEADELLPYLLALMGLTTDDRIRNRLKGLGSEAMQNLVIRAMTRFVARSSVLFVLAQREVGASLGPIREALQKIEPRRVLEVRLAPLPPSACEALVESRVRDLPHSIRRRIEKRTKGNPYYIAEVLRVLLDKGDLEDRNGVLHAGANIEAAVLPDSITEGILQRRDGLTDAAQRVLRVAAVVGRSARVSVLERVAEGLDVDAALDELARTNFLVLQEEPRSSWFSFAHPMIQEATYEAITREDARGLHRQIAEAIEATSTEDEPGHFGMLAYHFGQARDLIRAEKYLMLAGDEANRLAAPGEALHFFEEASRLFLEMRGEGGGDEERYERAQLEKKLGLAFFNRGKMEEGKEHFDHALVLLGQRVPRTPVRQVVHAAVACLSTFRELYVSRDPTRRPAPTQRDLEVIEMMYRAAFAQVTTDPTAFVIDSLEGLKRLNQVDPTKVPNAGGIYAASMAFFAYSGAPIGFGNRLLQLASTLVDEGDTRESFLYRTMNFIHQFLSGDWDERHTIDDALVQENLQIGELWNVTNYLPLEAMRRLHQGRFAEAEENLEQIAKIGDLYDYDLARSNELAVTMFIALERRDLKRAREVAEPYYERFDEPLINLLALSSSAKIELLLDNEAEAASALDRADPIVEREAFIPPFQNGALWLSRFALALHRYERARASSEPTDTDRLRRETKRCGRKAWRLAKKVAWRRPEVLRLLGRAAWLSGRERAAVQWWTRGAEEAQRLGMRPELGRIYGEAASGLAAARSTRKVAGCDAGSCHERAQALFLELDLQWDLERLEATPTPSASTCS
jgi:class 3 adenylate cyclase